MSADGYGGTTDTGVPHSEDGYRGTSLIKQIQGHLPHKMACPQAPSDNVDKRLVFVKLKELEFEVLSDSSAAQKAEDNVSPSKFKSTPEVTGIGAIVPYHRGAVGF